MLHISIYFSLIEKGLFIYVTVNTYKQQQKFLVYRNIFIIHKNIYIFHIFIIVKIFLFSSFHQKLHYIKTNNNISIDVKLYFLKYFYLHFFN